MRLLYCAGILCAIITVGCNKAPPRPAPDVSDSESGREFQVYELGRVFVSPDEHRQLKLHHTFRIENGTGDPVVLKSAGSSCGCTHFLVPSDPVPPWESTEIGVTIDAAGATGAVQEYADIQSVGKTGKTVRLKLSAIVVPRFEIDGLQETSIHVRPGTQEIVSFRLLARQPLAESAELTITEHSSDDDVFLLRVADTQETLLENGYRLVVANVQWTVKCANEVLDPFGVAERRELKFHCGEYSLRRTVALKRLLDIEASPSTPVLFRKIGESASKSIELKGRSPFAILSIRSSTGIVSVDAEMKRTATNHNVQIATGRLSSSIAPRAQDIQIDVETDMPSQRHFRLKADLVDRR